MGKIWMPGGGGGADTDVVTAGAGDVLLNKVIVGPDGEPLTGTMPGPFHMSQAISAGQNGYGIYYYISPGCHTYINENPWVYRPLSDFGGVPANKVVSGQTFTSTAGLKVTGTMAVTSAINFSAAAQSTTTIRISWKNPSKGPWTGVKIRMSTSGYPGVSGGTLKYTGTGSSTTAGASSYVDITGLTVGTTYYFTCYSYVTGLGDSTTGYNVSAKTKGLLIYDAGTQYYTLSSGDQNNCALTFNSNNIAFKHVTLTGGPIIRVATGDMDLSAYSKACINLSISAASKAYISFKVRYKKQTGGSYSNGTDGYYGSTSYPKADVSSYIETIIASITYTYESLSFEIKSMTSSTGGTIGYMDGYIYRIWLE